jgi:hypothetical protein
MHFTIGTDNNITAYDAASAAREEQLDFASEDRLGELAAGWPTARLVEIWNRFAGAPPFGGLRPVKTFTDRKTVVSRIWKAIQSLAPTPAPQAAAVAPEKAMPSMGAKAGDGAPAAREGGKKAAVLGMPRKQGGASRRSWPPPAGRGTPSAGSSARWARTLRSPVARARKGRGFTRRRIEIERHPEQSPDPFSGRRPIPGIRGE